MPSHLCVTGVDCAKTGTPAEQMLIPPENLLCVLIGDCNSTSMIVVIRPKFGAYMFFSVFLSICQFLAVSRTPPNAALQTEISLCSAAVEISCYEFGMVY